MTHLAEETRQQKEQGLGCGTKFEKKEGVRGIFIRVRHPLPIKKDSNGVICDALGNGQPK